MIGRSAAAAIAMALLAACGGSDSQGQPAASSTTVATGEFRYGSGACPPATPPAESPKSFDDAPERCIEDGVDYGAVVATSEGSFTADLLEGSAPGTVNNFVVLARWGWFDGDDFHRVVPGFVIQAGDPFGDPPGTGSPGYEIPDELPSSVADYQQGSIAMANHGPDTGGSQWFVCSDCSGLPGPDYPIFATVTDGLDVIARIDALGVADGPPSKPVTITSIRITER